MEIVITVCWWMKNWSMWATLKREKTSSLSVSEIYDLHDDTDDDVDDDNDGDDDDVGIGDDDDLSLSRAACKQMFCQGGFSGRKH